MAEFGKSTEDELQTSYSSQEEEQPPSEDNKDSNLESSSSDNPDLDEKQRHPWQEPRPMR